MSTNDHGNQGQERFLREVKQSLDSEVENIDEKIVLRLQKMRLQALQEGGEKKKRMFPAFRWVHAGALSTLGMAITFLVIWLYSHQSTFLFKNPEDFEILSSQDQIEFYENLDFYKWLATSDSNS